MDTTQLSGSVPTKFFSPVLQQQTWLQRWRSSVLSTLRLFDFWRACSGYKSVTSSELELTPGHERSSPQKLVQAITISPDKVEVCKTEQGKDWLLGMGSYGMVSSSSALHHICQRNSLVAHAMQCDLSNIQ